MAGEVSISPFARNMCRPNSGRPLRTTQTLPCGHVDIRPTTRIQLYAAGRYLRFPLVTSYVLAAVSLS